MQSPVFYFSDEMLSTILHRRENSEKSLSEVSSNFVRVLGVRSTQLYYIDICRTLQFYRYQLLPVKERFRHFAGWKLTSVMWLALTDWSALLFSISIEILLFRAQKFWTSWLHCPADWISFYEHILHLRKIFFGWKVNIF